MAEVANYVRRGSAQITPKILKGVQKKLLQLKVEFSQIQAPKHPHLIDQLEFLANVVEDFADNADEEIPLVATAGAAFALVYAHRQMDLIPDHHPELGFSDDSAIVRAVLMEHERVFADYAQRHRLNWAKITVKP